MRIFETLTKPKAAKKEKLRRGLGLNRRRELALLEDQENQQFNQPLIKDMAVEMRKTYQSLPMMSEDPYVHSHGVISPMQGIHALVEDVVDIQNCDNMANNGSMFPDEATISQDNN